MQIVVYGAKSIALGVCRAVQKLYKDFEIIGFLVTSREGNPDMLAGLPVYELKDFREKKVCVLVAAPEDVQGEIVMGLEAQGFHNHICVDWEKESELMGKYYAVMGEFPLLQAAQQGKAGRERH